MYFRKLVGEKCYLSPIDADDAEKFTEWLNDLDVTVNLQLYQASINAENERSFLNKLAEGHHYSIIDKKTDGLIGNCGFMDIDNLNQTAELGIFIGDKNYWGKGYGTEALSLLADYGFKCLNLHNIMLRVYSFNKRAIACYEKVGFKKIGIRREALYRNREVYDIIFMDLLAGDFYKV
ncbi:N-acetyltransferase [Spirochaetia bacterium]|nr:N-acetyltransferase [Spirochaetia bacterium]